MFGDTHPGIRPAVYDGWTLVKDEPYSMTDPIIDERFAALYFLRRSDANRPNGQRKMFQLLFYQLLGPGKACRHGLK